MNVAQIALLCFVLFLVFVLPVVAVLAWWLERRYAAAVARLQATKHPSARSLDDRADRTSGGPPGPVAFAPPLLVHVQPATDIILPREDLDPTLSTSPGRATGSGRRSSASAKLKMARLAPMPMASAESRESRRGDDYFARVARS